MPHPPKISIILCIFNGEKYLHQAIDSILNQTLTDFELILIDDGSSDNTLNILYQYKNIDSRCKIITGPNKGLIESRNKGILSAQSDIIALMDADDISMPTRLVKQLQYLQKNPDCVAVGSQVLMIDPENRPISTFLLGTSHQEIDDANMAGRGGAIINPSAAIRKSAIIDVGMYRGEYQHAEDIDLFLRLAEIGKLANIPETLLYYRQHMLSIGHMHAYSQRESTIRAVIAAQIRRKLAIATEDNMFASNTIQQNTAFHVYNKWAWWALNGGNTATARHYGWLTVRTNPFKISNLRLLWCLIRGH